eukprot:GILI01025956.1.p1 GENE.GILI01025956.1~~GILI01025956.1.p1  ORF type:complete len:551 (+),score=98.56 GILI01025956.1:194-1654(+)
MSFVDCSGPLPNFLASTSSMNKTVQVWSLSDCQHLSNLTGHSDVAACAHWSETKGVLLSGSADEEIRLWDLSREVCISKYAGHQSEVHVLSSLTAPTSPLNLFVSGSFDTTVKLWSWNMNKGCLATLRGHSASVIALDAFNHTVASAGYDHTVKLWDLRNMSHSMQSISVPGKVSTLQLDWRHLMIGFADYRIPVLLWDFSRGNFAISPDQMNLEPPPRTKVKGKKNSSGNLVTSHKSPGLRSVPNSQSPGPSLSSDPGLSDPFQLVASPASAPLSSSFSSSFSNLALSASASAPSPSTPGSGSASFNPRARSVSCTCQCHSLSLLSSPMGAPPDLTDESCEISIVNNSFSRATNIEEDSDSDSGFPVSVSSSSSKATSRSQPISIGRSSKFARSSSSSAASSPAVPTSFPSSFTASSPSASSSLCPTCHCPCFMKPFFKVGSAPISASGRNRRRSSLGEDEEGDGGKSKNKKKLPSSGKKNNAKR